MNQLERYRGSLLGLAAGDALRSTMEFSPPGSFAPLTDMIGGGPHALEAGKWTDDTSMALCLAESLIERRGFDAAERMKRYGGCGISGRWRSKLSLRALIEDYAGRLYDLRA